MCTHEDLRRRETTLVRASRALHASLEKLHPPLLAHSERPVARVGILHTSKP
jgi:hypothetical protein